jgi:hypothetical protein
VFHDILKEYYLYLNGSRFRALEPLQMHVLSRHQESHAASHLRRPKSPLTPL